jgi:hypothetical protein
VSAAALAITAVYAVCVFAALAVTLFGRES